jgi:hypothetical protein
VAYLVDAVVGRVASLGERGDKKLVLIHISPHRTLGKLRLYDYINLNRGFGAGRSAFALVLLLF